ncbi:MAG TPA: hypothetical protein VF679_00560 [Pedobacter sp.]|jgi:hypothetical protein
MKLKLLMLGFLFLSGFCTSYAQNTAAIKRNAQTWAECFWNGNIETALKYTDPRLVSNAGGKAEFTSNMKSTLAVLKAEGITFRGVKLGEVSKIYKAGTELHCAIPQQVSMNQKKGYFTIASDILAISIDNGKSWKFYTGDLSEKTIKKTFPNFNKELVLKKLSPQVIHE